MNKFKRSWKLAGRSIKVLWANKRLLIFPLIMIPLGIAVLLFFVAPLFAWNTGHSWLQEEHWEKLYTLFVRAPADSAARYTPRFFTPLACVYMGAFYFVSMVMATFSNVAMYHEILQALNGNTVSIRRGWRVAMTKWRAILAWSLFAGIVGVLLRTIEERLSFVGRWIVGLIGVAWSVAAVFAIPVIIRDEKASNPLYCLRGSAMIIKKTWGETAIGYLGLTIGGGLLLLGSIVLLGGATAISVWLHNYWIIAVSGALWILLMIAASVLLGVASDVYRAALFCYASEGVIPAAYDREMLDMAWKVSRHT